MKHIGRVFRAVDVFRLTHGGETSAGLGLVQLLAHDDDGYGLSLIGGAGALRDVVDRLAEGTIVVVEYGYFDADIRSEQKRLLDRLSTLPGFATPRLHFFKPDTSLELLQSWQVGKPGPSLNDAYLGYIVVRQHAGGSVGRTMLSPEAFNDELAARTRGSSAEEVDFYGRALTVTAVPFMEQDGLLVSCFHVCLWMAAYQMMLNGYLPRSTSGLVADIGTPSARYPTRGVPTDDAEDLGRELGFSVRHKALSSYTSQTEFERDVIHHLDSGLPIVMVAEADPPPPDELAPRQPNNEPKRNDADHHSILICGYTRKPDRTIDRLIYHDDRYGPYLSAPVPGAIPDRADRHVGGHRVVGGVARAATEHHELCVGSLDRMSTDTGRLLAAGLELAEETWGEACDVFGWRSGVDRFIVHQVSSVHTSMLCERLGVDTGRVPLTFPMFGNIGPASIPFTLAPVQQSSLPGQRVLLMGIGSGLNTAFTELVW